jgi:DNA polymerase-4
MLTALFVDMNSYFASCEQHARPELQGKPIAVAPVATDFTSCIAASYEAKAFGIKTGMAVWEAKKLCPQLQIVLARPALYIKLHHEILAAIDTCIPVKAVHSIDECACALMGAERQPAAAVAIATSIKSAIRQRIGSALRCSIGIAPNAYLAKVAADMRKPDGLTVLQQHELPYVLYPLKLDDFSGVGPRMLRRFHEAGIRTVEQMYAMTERQMRGVWNGVVGARMFGLIRGDDVPMPIIKRRSVGHSYVLPPDLRTPDGARGVMVRLIHKAAGRMRSMRLWTRRLELDVEIMRSPAWIARVNLLPCQDTHSILDAFNAIWQSPAGVPIRAGVTLTRCVHDAFMPAPLFECERKQLALSRVMDRINLRYGMHAVYYGAMHGAKDAAPLRISFTTIPDPRMPW